MSAVELESFPKTSLPTIDYESRQDNAKRRISDVGSTSQQSHISFSADIVLKGPLSLRSMGVVDAVLLHDRLIWEVVEDTKLGSLPCWRQPKQPAELYISDIYSVEHSEDVPFRKKGGSSFFCQISKKEVPGMHQFTVHSFGRSNRKKCCWIPKSYVFGLEDLRMCKEWVKSIQRLLDNDKKRPKKLLVFVNPYGGRKGALGTWRHVVPLFDRARVKTKIICTERHGHAFDVVEKATKEDLSSQDGIVVVGGDGLFNEILNGLLAHRHRAPLGPILNKDQPSSSVDTDEASLPMELESAMPVNLASFVEINGKFSGQADLQPLLDENTSQSNTSDVHNSNACIFPLTSSVNTENFTSYMNELSESSSSCASPILQLPIGIIPAGSTDTIAISTTGSRDPVTSALHIILGEKMPLDVVRLVNWQSSKVSKEDKKPQIRYAASFAGYGFFGDVAKESDLSRWMGPPRYDYAGAKVFLRHKKYAAKISFLDISEELEGSLSRSSNANNIGQFSYQNTMSHMKNVNQVICRRNCPVCARSRDGTFINGTERNARERYSKAPFDWKTANWRIAHGNFQSVGASVMSCRNNKAPDGMSTHAHLSDGLLDLILVRDCSRLSYLRQLIELSRRGDDHLRFKFVEHYKTPMFTFVSCGEESVWSVDGETFPAHKLSAQVFRGLINIFASGPEV